MGFLDEVILSIKEKGNASVLYKSQFTPEFKKNYEALNDIRGNLYQKLKAITCDYNCDIISFDEAQSDYEIILEIEYKLFKVFKGVGLGYKYIYDYWNEERKLMEGQERTNNIKKYWDKIQFDNSIKLDELTGRKVWTFGISEENIDFLKGYSREFWRKISNSDLEIVVLGKKASLNTLRNLIDNIRNKEKLLPITEEYLVSLIRSKEMEASQ